MAYRFAPTMVLWPYFRWRGQDQVLCRSGIEGAIAFLKETQELMDMVLKTGGWQTLTLDVTSADREDRETNRRAMLNFLGISEVQVYPPALAAALKAYTGMYVAEEPESSIRTLEVRIEQDRLVLYRPGMRLGPLVPVSATRLHLMSTPVDVEFVLEEAWGRSTVSRAPLVERRDTCLSPDLTPKERRSEAHALVLAA